MATDIVQSLFGVTPDMYQQQQAQQADARALRFAQLTPMQQAQYGIGRGAYGLAGAIGGALGAQDPELQRVSARNSIAQQINYNNPESIMQGVNALSQAGDTVGAMQLADVARKLESEMAQSFQRRAAGTASLAQAARERVTATPEKVQLARELALVKGQPGSPEFQNEYNTQLMRLTSTEKTDAMTPDMRNAAALAAQAGPVGSPEYNAAYQAQLTRLTTKPGTNEPTTNELTNARALASQKGAPGSPEYNAELQLQLVRLTGKPSTNEPTTNELTNARALAAQAGPVGSPEYNAEFQSQLRQLTAKADGRPPTTNELTNARAVALRAGAEGTPEYNAAFDAEYRRLTTAKDVREPTTTDLTNARAVALRAGAEGTPEYNAAFDAEYTRLTTKDVREQKPEIQRLQEYAATLRPGSPELAQVQARIKAMGEPGGTRVEVKNVMPGDKALADIPAFRASVQRTIDGQLKTITATDQALTAINDSLATGNFAAYRAAQVQFARAIAGAGDLSQKELKAAGADPSLLGGAADTISTLFSSTPTNDTQKKIRSTLQAIQTVARKQATDEINAQRAIALRSPGYNPAAVNEALTFPQLQGRPAPPAAGGDLAAQAAAELARRRGGK